MVEEEDPDHVDQEAQDGHQEKPVAGESKGKRPKEECEDMLPGIFFLRVVIFSIPSLSCPLHLPLSQKKKKGGTDLDTCGTEKSLSTPSAKTATPMHIRKRPLTKPHTTSNRPCLSGRMAKMERRGGERNIISIMHSQREQKGKAARSPVRENAIGLPLGHKGAVQTDAQRRTVQEHVGRVGNKTQAVVPNAAKTGRERERGVQKKERGRDTIVLWACHGTQ